MFKMLVEKEHRKKKLLPELERGTFLFTVQRSSNVPHFPILIKKLFLILNGNSF